MVYANAPKNVFHASYFFVFIFYSVCSGGRTAIFVFRVFIPHWYIIHNPSRSFRLILVGWSFDRFRSVLRSIACIGVHCAYEPKMKNLFTSYMEKRNSQETRFKTLAANICWKKKTNGFLFLFQSGHIHLLNRLFSYQTFIDIYFR